MFEDPYAAITDGQQQFVLNEGATLDNRGWTTDYRRNLFAPLHPDSLRDFEEAGELSGNSGCRIAAPHSSTALAINVFDVWRRNDLGPLSAALNLDIGGIVGYELPHRFGLRRAAQPDIELRGITGSPVAIEVKLREPYGTVTNEFADRYFNTPHLWDGLPALQKLATRIRDGEISFTTLHAAQLVKHALGLTKSYGQNFVLGYLWHYVSGTTGNNHLRELDEFADFVHGDISFESVTIAELLDRSDLNRTDSAWLTYMADRYVTPTDR